MQQILFFSEREDQGVDWVFKFCSTVIGCQFCRTAESHLASVVYSNMQAEAAQLRIPIWDEYYDSNAEHCLNRNGYWVPVSKQNAGTHLDYIGLIFRLLNLIDEFNIADSDRDQFGIFPVTVNLQRMDFHDSPMVDKAVYDLQQNLIERGFLRDSEMLPRWPDKKRYAILLTHDTDGPCLLEPMELAKAGFKGIIRRNVLERKAFLEGCRKVLSGGQDPYFNFAHWAEFEKTFDTKSTFYIYVKSKGVPNHIHNPLYCIQKSKAKWNILQELADQGWEIGLHASIRALESDRYIKAEKSDLENFLGMPIIGNRSHYWCINWRNSVESFRRLESAGFIYDCSIAWNDSPGFRSGTSMPYYPFDPQHRRALSILEIPTNLMDGHLFEFQSGTNPHTWFTSLVQQVRDYGGVLNLDWHTRTWVDKFSYEGWRSFLVSELVKLADSGEVWFTTPKNLCEYWLTRERYLFQKIE